jgi:hypothetical protein
MHAVRHQLKDTERRCDCYFENGADINPQVERTTNALRAASAGGHEKVVPLLLEKGADI